MTTPLASTTVPANFWGRRQREAEQLADTGIAEMQHLIGGGLDNNGAMLTQMHRAWDAQDAVLENLRDRPAASA
jgi:hypothetical protein